MRDVFDTCRPRGLLALLIWLLGGGGVTGNTTQEIITQTDDNEASA